MTEEHWHITDFKDHSSRDYSELRAHVSQYHPKITRLPRSNADLGKLHATHHWRYGSTTHHHGPTAGAADRPRGWYTGQDVTETHRGHLSHTKDMP